MLLATDVQYDDAANVALAAGVVFHGSRADEATERVARRHRGLVPYQPGAFFRRELPCILPLIEDVRSRWSIDWVLVDGFVDLGAGPGLGRHLFEALGRPPETGIIGVSKTSYAGNPGVPLTRGASAQPLWVTSTGDVQAAVEIVANMHGRHRIPTMLRLADAIARGHEDVERWVST